jgi:hypothetical protein
MVHYVKVGFGVELLLVTTQCILFIYLSDWLLMWDESKSTNFVVHYVRTLFSDGRRFLTLKRTQQHQCTFNLVTLRYCNSKFTNIVIIAIGILTLRVSCQNKSMTNSTLKCQVHSSCSINHSFFSPLQSMFNQSTSVQDELQYFLDMLIHHLIMLKFTLFDKENIDVKA